jgi:ATP-dependent Clp protease ATP-binding subunit ClpA
MSKDIHPRVKIVINKAIKEAQTLDDIQVRPEHIIISILTDEENDVLKYLKIKRRYYYITR